MKSKFLINKWLILIVAVFSPAYFSALYSVEKHHIDIGHLGQAIVELATIPALIMPLFVFGYSLAYMVSTKKLSVLLVLSMICSGSMLSGFIMQIFMDPGV
ncbi:hypothetical protein [Niabella hibiscisoli]|uniref:hypothetical protein n=1 Tax=Niabella hibiscisoli TaxID=1825928 RepID=UPI001F0CFCA5|nr:hypothetical protein [Niabella hibiscisoli]MCH5715955.1 hypothetical protein [Niabella hibiscisoli]